MYLIGKININIYKCITTDICSEEVIITDTQIAHIQERHPEAFKKTAAYLKDAISDPDYIFRDKRKNTGLVIKKYRTCKGYIQLVLRICTSYDNPNYKNSIISCWEISEKRLKNYLRNKRILYKKE